MHRPQQQVQQFHREVTNQPCSPAAPELRMPQLRALLILEEAIEAAVALVGASQAQSFTTAMMVKVLQKIAQQKASSEPSVIGAIGELCDILVVTYGTAEAIGVDLEPFYDEVMAANFAKKDGPVDENGKIGKPLGWQPADLAGVFRRVSEKRAGCTCSVYCGRACL